MQNTLNATRHLKWIFTICIFFWVPQITLAQNYRIKEYNNNNGLISAENHNTYQDSAGYYWITCFGGLVRFDGTTFKPFRNSDGLKNFDVTQLIEEKKNKFWVCNDYTLFTFDGHTFHEQATNIPKPVGYRGIIRLSKGALILLTDNGLYRKETDSIWRPFHPGGVSTTGRCHLIEYKKGNLLLLNPIQKQLLLIRNDTLQKTWALPSSFKLLHSYLIDSLPYLATSDGLFAVSENGLHLYTPPGFSGPAPIRSSFRDKKKMLWLTDAEDALWKLENQGWQNMSLRYKIKKMPDPDYLQDKDGNLIITTISGMTVFKESPCNEIVIPQFDSANDVYFATPYHGDTVCGGIGKKGLLLLQNGRLFFEPLILHGELNYEGVKGCYISKYGVDEEYIIYIPGVGIFTLRQHELRPFYKHPADFTETYLSWGYDSLQHLCYISTKNKVLLVNEEKIDMSCPEIG